MNILSDKYRKIGEQIREELFPELQGLNIAWLESTKFKRKNGKITLADCAKINPQYDWCCGEYDYKITVYAPNVAELTDEQIKILLEHELMHIDFDGEKKKIRAHDAEEFIEIIRKYGIDWAGPEWLREANKRKTEEAEAAE